MKKTVIFGGSFNPPGTHHVRIAEKLAKRFDEVIVVPCGPRPDKETVNDTDPVHRAAMADLAFRNIPNVKVDLFDLECGTFTRTAELDRRYASSDREVWHFVGTDLVQNGGKNASFIHRTWHQGERLWNELRFVVGERDGYAYGPADLPRQHEVIGVDGSGSSSEIRRRLFEREYADDLMPDSVRAYVERYGLYRGKTPHLTAPLALERPKAALVYDSWNTNAVELAKRLEAIRDEDDPDCVVVIGGDGTMLHAIRQHWQRRLPFVGVNTGGRGFLLNDPARALAEGGIGNAWRVERHPLLFVEAERMDGTRENVLAFNEAWLERSSGQTAWTEVRVNDEVRLPKLVSDGVLIGTPAGSTGYARAMGAPALPLTASVLTVIGSNVLEPSAWKWAHLPQESIVTVTSVGGDKRPIRMFADGVDMGAVRGMRVRMSRVAAAELAFAASHDMARKLAHVQFPKAEAR